MKKDRQATNWIVDAVLFVGFVAAMLLDLTGLALHEWLGAAVTGLAFYHLLVHWAWVRTVTARFFGRTSGQARRFYILDAALFVGFLAIALSGLVISTWLDLALANYAAWRDAHVVASLATLAAVVLKVALHWRWVVSVAAKKVLPQQAMPQFGRPVPVAARITNDRRDFFRLMTIVGAAALVSAVRALDDSSAAQASEVPAAGQQSATVYNSAASPAAAATATATPATAAPATATPATAAPTTTPTTAAKSSTAQTTTTAACTVRCNKRCPYPGRCRKYVDANANRLCDLGECLPTG